MKFLLRAHVFILISIFVVMLAGTGFMYHKTAMAFHLPELFLFSPTTAGTDDVAGMSNASYDVYYSPLFQNTITTLTLTFPSGYVITDGVLDPSTAITSSLQSTCAGTPGFMCVSGDDTTYSVTSMIGDSVFRTITITIDPLTVVGFHNADFQFSILQGIQNPTTAGVYAASTFDASNDGDNSGTLLKVGPDVTITSDVFDHLSFIAEPAFSPAPPNGNVTANTVFTTQPMVGIYDQYNNLVTSYTDDIGVVAVTAGTGSLYSNTRAPGCYTVSGSVKVIPSGGIADFSSAEVGFFSETDGEPFQVKAIECNASGEVTATTSFISDIVATALVWASSPSGCTSGSACSTQGTIEAHDSFDSIDADYSGSIALGSTGAGTLIGTTPQTMTAGTLTTVGLGYNNVDRSIDETIDFTADSGILTQGVSSHVVVAAAPVTPPSPTPAATPTPEAIGAGFNPNKNEIPGAVAIKNQTPSNNTASCAAYLSTFLRKGNIGDAVKKLQEFLRKQSFFIHPTNTGFFGSITEQAVKAFQLKYAADILTPQQLTQPTGLVLGYTTKKINAINCGK